MKFLLKLFCLFMFVTPVMAGKGLGSYELTPQQNTSQSKQTIKVKVSGITCAGDSKDIQKSVTKINGILDCKLLGKAAATSVFEITFNPALVTEKEIRKAVEDTPGCENPDDRPYKVKS